MTDTPLDIHLLDQGVAGNRHAEERKNRDSEKRCAVCGVDVTRKWFSTASHIINGIYYCKEHHRPLGQWAKDEGIILEGPAPEHHIAGCKIHNCKECNHGA